LNNFPVPLLPLAEQERIGDIFSSIDQKIALNRAINDNLPTPDHSLAVATTRLAA